MEAKENRAREQAKSQLESIINMVDRLRHCQECQDPECDLSDKEIFLGSNLYYRGQPATKEDRMEYHNEDLARQAINEDPLTIQVRSDWHFPHESGESTEYEILLCTGGPACRIIGELGQYNEPETARLQYQDWFTPWEDYSLSAEEEEYLIEYAQCFYFGE